MNFDPSTSIVRILNESGETVGTGFFACEGNKIITCAHVIEYAESSPGKSIKFICLKEREKIYWAKVMEDGWRDSSQEDIAILETNPDDSFSQFVKTASFGSSFNAVGRTLHTFGFPPRMPQDGLNALCNVIGQINQNGRPILQLRSQEITFGYSGAPAWDSETGLVNGMVVSMLPDGDGSGTARTSFITPVETIRSVYKDFNLVEGDCPYRGLEFFGENDKEIYFGRRKIIEELINCLARNNLVAVVGVSGSGKSSLIRAGLAQGIENFGVPELRAKTRVLFQNYGQTPLFNLLKVLIGEDGDSAAIEENVDLSSNSSNDDQYIVDILAESEPSGIVQRLVASINAKGSKLLILDQFERLFTDGGDDKACLMFMDVLHSLAENDVKILISLRADYYGKVLAHSAFGNKVKSSQVTVPHMTKEELKSAIELPSKRLGREFEPELSKSLIDDVFGRPGELPLLEFALQELWKMDAASGVLTFRSYEDLGYEDITGKISGVRGAIVKRAEEVWQKLKEAGKEKIAEKIFLSLVTPTEQSKKGELILGADASRRARLSEFDTETRQVADELAQSFLLTTSQDLYTGQPTIEISHEALIQHWTRLHRLTQINYLFLKWYVQDFVPYFQRWLDEPKPLTKARLLLPEVILQEAKQWEKRQPEFFKGPRSEYISQSARKQKFRRLGQILIMSGAVIALIIIFFGWHSTNESRGNELQERGIQALLKQDYQQAQLLLAESLTYRDSYDARGHLLESRVNGALIQDVNYLHGTFLAATANASHLAFKAGDGTIKVWERAQLKEKTTDFNIGDADSKDFRVALDPDGEILAFGNLAGEVQLWDLKSNQKIQAGLPRSEKDDKSPSGIDSVAIASDRNLIAYGNMDGKIHVWNRTNGKDKILDGGAGAVHCLAFSEKDHWLVSGDADASVRVWDLDSVWNLDEKNSKGLVLLGHEDYITSVTFNSSSNRVASGGADGSIRVWDVRSEMPKPELYMLIGHLGAVKSVRFNPESSLIVSGSEDKTIRLWDTSIRKQILMLGTYNKRSVLYSGFIGNNHIVSGNEDGALKVWEISRRPEGQTYYNSSAVGAVVFYPNNEKLAIGDGDGKVQIWDINTHEISLLAKTRDGSSVDCLAVRASDGLLAAGEYDGNIQIWDSKNQTEQPGPPKTDKPIWAIAFHPTRPLLVFGGQDKFIHVWNLQTGREEYSPLSHENSSVWTLSFSSDGLYLASGGGDGKIRIWDATTFQKLNTFEPKDGDELWAVPFGPNNKTIVSAGLDRKVRVWSFQDVLTKLQSEPLKVSLEHEGIIQSAALYNDWIATASADHTVRIWNLETENSISLELHDRPVWWVNFSSDGKFLASGGIDKRVRVSSMDSINHVLTASVTDLLTEAKKHTCLELDEKRQVIFTPCMQN